MSILISGSLAYDHIMDFPDYFKSHILPEQIHILNVSFTVGDLRKNFGGCAGNIGYTMKLLGAEPIILSALGNDAGDYLAHFDKFGLEKRYVKVVGSKQSSIAHIITDKDDNQIVAYYDGAGEFAAELSVADVKSKIDLAIICPAKKDAMLKHARECRARKIPYVFDPSHALTLFSGEELDEIISGAEFFIGNDYEMKLALDKTGLAKKDLREKAGVVITTLGRQGSLIETKKETVEVGVCPVEAALDPTGAGDAYRAGFFIARAAGRDWQTCGQAGAVAAAYTVETYGTQTHYFTREDFKKRYKEAFGEELKI